MQLSWGLLALILLGAAVLWFWQDSLAARESANAAAKEACTRLGLQFLDGTVAFARLALVRVDGGFLQLRRTYVFDYTATSMVCSDTVNAINARRAAKQGTAKADYLKLDDMGILGVTHMMMLDKKNLEIADVIYGWLDKNVRSISKTPVTRSARR